MQGLKLHALDAQDLEIISAHMQDALLQAADMTYDRRQQHFILAAKRFDWHLAQTEASLTRRACLLQFARVQAVQSKGLQQSQQPEQILSLLSIQFEPAQSPSGDILLTFSGGASLRLQVECIEVSLADGQAQWAASRMPAHEGEA